MLPWCSCRLGQQVGAALLPTAGSGKRTSIWVQARVPPAVRAEVSRASWALWLHACGLSYSRWNIFRADGTYFGVTPAFHESAKQHDILVVSSQTALAFCSCGKCVLCSTTMFPSSWRTTRHFQCFAQEHVFPFMACFCLFGRHRDRHQQGDTGLADAGDN